jgi:hypothetical protein
MITEMHNPSDSGIETVIRTQMQLLGHDGYGVTEFRTCVPVPMVAYADNTEDAIGLCLEMDSKTNVYVGVQPRPAHLFDLAPNRWIPARGGQEGNCARDDDIEYMTALAWDFDVVSPQRQMGHPASDEELEHTLFAAQLLSRHEGLVLSSAICCTGNGHQVWAPIVPISVDRPLVALQFKLLCEQIAAKVADKVGGVRIDPIYNLSRVVRVSGTLNVKGQPLPDRPHRRACFVTEPVLGRSMALHYMILGTDVGEAGPARGSFPTGLKCDLTRIEKCPFIAFCRRYPAQVSEPMWFALIANLVHLQGGIPLVHEISRLDTVRYDYANTQRVIDRTLREGYRPASCRTIMSPVMVRPGRTEFRCSRIGHCPARAPMYMAISHIV